MGRGTDADRAERHGIANWMGYELNGPTRSAVAAGTEADEAFVVGVDAGILIAYVPAHFCWENGEGWRVGEGVIRERTRRKASRAISLNPPSRP